MDPSTGVFVKVAEVTNTDSGVRVNITMMCLNHFPNCPASISLGIRRDPNGLYTGHIYGNMDPIWTSCVLAGYLCSTHSRPTSTY